jgi:predicted metal-dependent HD superfamily phosphohydrolase
MDITNELLRETALYLEPYFEANLPLGYEFRNFAATLKIVQTCDLISVHTDLQKPDRMKILLAAWFQYTGFCTDPENYQKASAGLATRYFKEKGLSPENIQEIEEFILATRYPQQPVTIQAQVLCDAEKSWLADKTFFRTLKNLRKEKVLAGKKEILEKDWLAENILMLENHIFLSLFPGKCLTKKSKKTFAA